MTEQSFSPTYGRYPPGVTDGGYSSNVLSARRATSAAPRGVTVRQLLFHLNAIFDRSSKKRLLVATLLSIVTSLLDTLAIALVLPLVNLATGRGASSAVVRAISEVTGLHDDGSLTALVAGFVVSLFILKDLGTLAFTWWLTGFIYTERVQTSARILDYMLRAPYSEVGRRSQADLMRSMDSAVVTVFTLSLGGLMNGFTACFAVASILTTLFVVAFIPTLALTVYFGVATMIFARLTRPRASTAGKSINEASVDGYKMAFAALGTVKEIKLRGSQTYFVNRFRDAQLRGAYAARTANFIGVSPRYLLEIMFVLAVGIVLVTTQPSSHSGSGPGISVIALYVTAGFRILPAVTSLLSSVSNIRVGADSLQTVQNEVEAARAARREDARKSSPGAETFRDFAELRFDDVTFRYPDSSGQALKGVSFRIERGQSVALVGASGAGKTTLVDLLLGLRSPTNGSIFVDNTCLARRLGDWQGAIGYVAQEVYILDASLVENVAFDVPRNLIDRDRVLTVLDQAELSQVLDELPDGLDTQLGERGTRLSGGQRQRVGIARALYRSPSVLVLDEATSALDNETEHRINMSIARLHGSVTIVVVAHRLSTVRNVDNILFLDSGRVAGEGTFEVLRSANHNFARLVALGSLDAPQDNPGESLASDDDSPRASGAQVPPDDHAH